MPGDDIACFVCCTPRRVALSTMAWIAGVRWSIEETFQTAKGETGLDHYRSASTPAGTGTSPWPCSPTRS
jgi:SRSO17 transposase